MAKASPTQLTSVTLRLPYPPSVNHYWRHYRGMFLVSTEGKSFRASVQGEVWRELGLQNKPIAGRIAVSIEAIMPDKRRRDIDNLPKAVLDALAFSGVYLDDEQIDELYVRRLHVEPPGCVDITIQEIAATAAGEN